MRAINTRIETIDDPMTQLNFQENYVGQLLQLIDQNEYLNDNLNVTLTSDHGLQEILPNHTVILDDYVDTPLFSAYGR